MSYPRQSILFINNLDKAANETLLYQLFNEFPVSYIKIAKDHQTRESYGYAFVGFKNHAKAEEAIIKLNYSKILKKSIRLSWYNREPNNYRQMPEYNVFVKKIHKDIKPKEFHDFFSKYGNIISAKLVEDEEGDSIGCGFVLYDSVEAAKSAIKEANNFEWKGKKIYVGPFIKNRPKKQPQFNTIYVKNLPKELSQEQIKKLFSTYGEISSVFIKPTDAASIVKLPENKRTHILNHQFAFLTFKDPQASMRVVDEFPYLKQNDKKFNDELKNIVEVARKTNEVEERHLYRFAAYLIEENEKEYPSILTNKTQLTETIQAFKKYMLDNDDNYIVKDKHDRIECCQALKKRERIKKLRILYEKIKKQIKEKYKFCNLYIKNLPDDVNDEQLQKLFSKYGQIRSCKTCKKDLGHSMIGIKRSVKIYGFVCFFDASQAREAKNALNNQSVFPNTPKLFVDYHQTRQERQEYLKLKMISQNQKSQQKGGFVESPFPKMMGQFGPGMRQFPLFAPQMLRKFPFNSPHMNPAQMNYPSGPFNPPPQQNTMDLSQMDENTKKEFFGDKLFSKISMNQHYSKFSDLHGKIVGIFIELDDNILMRLLQDDNYFHTQVMATVKELREKIGNA